MKINFLKMHHTFKKKSTEINPNLYWTFVFFAGLILTLLAFTFGIYLFHVINQEPAPSASSSTGELKTVKKEDIDKVLQYFSAREKQSNEILNSPSPVADPSL